MIVIQVLITRVMIKRKVVKEYFIQCDTVFEKGVKIKANKFVKI